MKELYTKPMLGVELFSLAQSVARDCDNTTITGDWAMNAPETCTYNIAGGPTLFIAQPACMIPADSGLYGCYNNPGEGQYIFHS